MAFLTGCLLSFLHDCKSSAKICCVSWIETDRGGDKSMQMTMIEAMNNALALVLEQDIGVNGGVFRVTEHLQKKFGETRVFDTPLSESAIIGSAVGMSIYGLRPVAEIQ